MQTIKVESAKDQMLRDFSQTLLQEIHKIAEQLQESFREELRRELEELRSNLAKDRHAAQFFRGSECVSKATTERGPARPQLKQARSFHFSPHVWATRHIRRYRQSEDEDEEDTEGEELRVKSTKSRVPSRPSTAASRPRVSFALSKQSSCDLRAVASSPHPHRPVVLLGQEAELESKAEEVIGHQVQDPPGVIQTDVDAVTNSLDLPARLDSQGLTVRKDDSSGGDGSQLLSPTRASQPRPKTKAVSVRPADQRRNGCESIEVAMGLRAMFSENHQRHRDLGGCRRWISRFVRSQKFEYLVVAVIVTHTVLVGAQINWMTLSGTADPSPGFRAMDILICIFFATEVGLRLTAHGFKFFYMLGWGWNVLDFFLVLAQLLEEILILASNGHYGGMDFGVLRIVRTLRCIRLLRVLRLTRFFDDLRRLVACIVYSAKSFIWSVMFVFLLVYIYGLYLTQSVHLHRLETGKNAAGDEVLAEYFGTVGRSILSLFQALTGGIDWRDLVEPLSEYMNWGWGLATVIWIAFLMLGVMNIITGNFVSAAMERSQSVKDVDNVFQARRLFKSLDIDDNEAITIDEIRRHLESKPVQHFFRTIDVDSSEAEVLFEILDLSGDGSIDKEEFISGCLRLQGAARAVDLLLMTKDTRRGFEQILIYLEELTSRLDATQDTLLARSESGKRSNSDGLS
ncbi:Muscle calcium channel subunit alpha-1 (MDL-alpha-1) [Durusdinium trenchii]|uniref:Muscle calcium channel subunit alpha-1 (MDL-alpha-1) n=1 Tax=Durusdinium trenchii TaxID=1381693 RepID=A0ABP0P9D9_9DINO